ncbi:CLUMA_CG001094, isoform A [Clunio marinus]|uniref:CLUMA_CG001094, isoform A n=1 Tax=Clunio marinus TaxID=568069 RepID=A0A1J1HIR1_9DIPT|nr:CLUMA_CG001094, isoform A [Clunio marinus]
MLLGLSILKFKEKKISGLLETSKFQKLNFFVSVVFYDLNNRKKMKLTKFSFIFLIVISLSVAQSQNNEREFNKTDYHTKRMILGTIAFCFMAALILIIILIHLRARTISGLLNLMA